MQSLFTQQEADHVIAKLHPLPPDSIGGSQWINQHRDLESIAYQANCEVLHSQKESTKDLLIGHDKLSLLVADLLVSEAWIHHCVPLLQKDIAQCKDIVLSYSVISHEALVASLLQMVLHHKEAAEALSEEAALELCDWCTRKLSIFHEKKHHQEEKKTQNKPQSSSPTSSSSSSSSPQQSSSMAVLKERILSCTEEEELQQRITESNTSAAFSALSILQYLVSHSSSLSLCVLHRIVCDNNAMATTIHLLRIHPWERVKEGSQSNLIERWESGSWVSLPSIASKQTICALEAQTWMLLAHLLMDPLAASKIDFTDERLVDELLSLRRQILPRRFDQLPFVEDIQRFLDSLALGMAQDRSVYNDSNTKYDVARTIGKVVIDHTPQLRHALLRNVDWKVLAEKQKKEVFGTDIKDQRHVQEQYKHFLENVEYLYQNIDVSTTNKESQPASHPSVKIDVFTPSTTVAALSDQWVWHGSYRFDINKDIPAESITIPFKPENIIETIAVHDESSNNKNEAGMVHGKRYRLTAMLRSTGIAALPPEGKLLLSFNGNTIETIFSLPSNGFRNTEGLPAGCWITAGSLQQDGLVLQLKVKKVERATERSNSPHGDWCVYTPSTGAITMRSSSGEEGEERSENA